MHTSFFYNFTPLDIQCHVSDMKDRMGATDFVSEIKGVKNTLILRI